MKLFLSLALFSAFLLCPTACADGVRDGLSLAAREALPALFPFFLTGDLLVRTGFAERLGKAAARPLAWLYGLPPAAAPAVILGLTGGYPVGAATAAGLAARGALSQTDAARVNAFCNCASAGFCVALVGAGVFGSARTGAVLYLIHITAALLTGLFVARGACAPRAADAPASAPAEGFAAAFCGATQHAAHTALTVTAFLTVFSILLRLLAPVLEASTYGGAFAGLFELTRGLDGFALLPLPVGARLTLASFLLGFGGLAVHFQVRALVEPAGLSCALFTCGKLLHGTLAAALTALVFRLSPAALTVFAAGQTRPHAHPFTAAALAVAVLCIIV